MSAQTRIQPYIIFTVLSNEPTQRLALWRSHRAQVLAARVELQAGPDYPPRSRTTGEPPTFAQLKAPKGESAVIWRLFSANHREIGSSARHFDSFEQARRQALLVGRHVEDIESLRLVEPLADRFAWVLALRDSPVLVANHWYENHRDRNRALGIALNALRQVQIADTLDGVVDGHPGSPQYYPLVDDPARDRSRSVRPIREAPPRRPLNEISRRRREDPASNGPPGLT